jgi:hypothetical protein
VGGAEAVVQVALVFVEMRGVRMTVGAAIGVGMFMRVGVRVIVGVIMIVIMPFNAGFAFATAANGTHLQTPAMIPK